MCLLFSVWPLAMRSCPGPSRLSSGLSVIRFFEQQSVYMRPISFILSSVTGHSDSFHASLPAAGRWAKASGACACFLNDSLLSHMQAGVWGLPEL